MTKTRLGVRAEAGHEVLKVRGNGGQGGRMRRLLEGGSGTAYVGACAEAECVPVETERLLTGSRYW